MHTQVLSVDVPLPKDVDYPTSTVYSFAVASETPCPPQ